MIDELHGRLEIKSIRADSKPRNVTVSSSTKILVERLSGLEVLSHGTGAVDMERAKHSLPLLFAYQPKQVVGAAQKF